MQDLRMMILVVGGMLAMWVCFWWIVRKGGDLVGWYWDKDKYQPHRFTAEEMAQWQAERERTAEEEYVAWDEVEAARRNTRMQRHHDVAQGQERYLRYGRACPLCHREPRELAWFYYKGRSRKGEELGYREGWMIVCDPCHQQVSFFMESIS